MWHLYQMLTQHSVPLHTQQVPISSSPKVPWIPQPPCKSIMTLCLSKSWITSLKIHSSWTFTMDIFEKFTIPLRGSSSSERQKSAHDIPQSAQRISAWLNNTSDSYRDDTLKSHENWVLPCHFSSTGPDLQYFTSYSLVMEHFLIMTSKMLHLSRQHFLGGGSF